MVIVVYCCVKCGKEVEFDFVIVREVCCLYCGSKIFYKFRFCVVCRVKVI